MASFISPRLRYFHIPRTGGRWLTRAFDQAKIPICCLKNHGPFSQGASQYTFTIIRNPITWYQSYWAYKCEADDWDIINKPLDRLTFSNKFPKFIDNVVQNYPGYYSQLIKDTIGGKLRLFTAHIDYVVRLETLKEDLKKVFGESGESVPSNFFKLRNTFHANYANWVPKYLPGQELAIYETEKEVFDAFYFEEKFWPKELFSSESSTS